MMALSISINDVNLYCVVVVVNTTHTTWACYLVNQWDVLIHPPVAG